ncbi:hypothetical protein RugamoR57_37240 [Duganella caerulea]|uniref:hypothetical protein n=1 Tax=Duganella caerulea TaxID=2885762 RepID=UPI0030E7DE88
MTNNTTMNTNNAELTAKQRFILGYVQLVEETGCQLTDCYGDSLRIDQCYSAEYDDSPVLYLAAQLNEPWSPQLKNVAVQSLLAGTSTEQFGEYSLLHLAEQLEPQHFSANRALRGRIAAAVRDTPAQYAEEWMQPWFNV